MPPQFPSGRFPIWKRSIDLAVSLLGIAALSPLFAAAAALIKLDSAGPVFFRQERVGRGLRSFSIYKFRTMKTNAQSEGPLITAVGDPRITRVGKVLRDFKIDELPQLINVLRGDMTLVGPRPEVHRYVNLFRDDYEEILQMRPGITDLASLKYRNESAILAKASDPEQEYVSRLLPDKIRLAKEYIERSSFLFDVGLILKTVRSSLLD